MTRRLRMDDDDPDPSDSTKSTTTLASQYAPPSESEHYKSLTHCAGDVWLHNRQELCNCLQKLLVDQKDEKNGKEADKNNNESSNNNMVNGRTVALWSCICGYMEALATHKLPTKRFQIFPVPFSALERLVDNEFIPSITNAAVNDDDQDANVDEKVLLRQHKRRVQTISNLLWSKAKSKPNVRDELHANSLYVVLRGSIDGKSLDCFGSALISIASCQILQQQQAATTTMNQPPKVVCSYLTLSEDHAYESHVVVAAKTVAQRTEAGSKEQQQQITNSNLEQTCEVAIPGTTKAAKAKRGKSVAEIFADESKKRGNNELTPANSWLYLAHHPVVCRTTGMTLVALVGNINCTLGNNTKPPTSSSKKSLLEPNFSGQLYDVKRDLLWMLYDMDHMTEFPFGLLELGDCEEYRSSPRGETWVSNHGMPDSDEPILFNEYLFWQAIQINRGMYDNAQTYPYFYTGHYHKDAGGEGDKHEYRYVHSVRHYALAAETASKYYYQGMDSTALNQHFSSVAMIMAEDIWSGEWVEDKNAIAAGTWLLAFLDSLLFWEERSGAKSFVEILRPSHKHFVGKLWQLLPMALRQQSIKLALGLGVPDAKDSMPEQSTLAATKTDTTTLCVLKSLPQFVGPTRSKRLQAGTMLVKSLEKPKVVIGEMELAIPMDNVTEAAGGRRSKRQRRRS